MLCEQSEGTFLIKVLVYPTALLVLKVPSLPLTCPCNNSNIKMKMNVQHW